MVSRKMELEEASLKRFPFTKICTVMNGLKVAPENPVGVASNDRKIESLIESIAIWKGRVVLICNRPSKVLE